VHASILRKHIAVNQLGERIEVVEAAAASSDGLTYLSDQGVCSKTSDSSSSGGSLKVQRRDLFNLLNSRGVIDVMKIDIEGAEDELFADPRFGELSIRAIIMEWHENLELCIATLTKYGFSVSLTRGSQDDPFGILSATRVFE
jgi:FkbM family methyltransferase